MTLKYKEITCSCNGLIDALQNNAIVTNPSIGKVQIENRIVQNLVT